jgi:hypothetical protein
VITKRQPSLPSSNPLNYLLGLSLREAGARNAVMIFLEFPTARGNCLKVVRVTIEREILQGVFDDFERAP